MRLAQGRKFQHGFLSGEVYAERKALQVIIKRYTLAVEINPVEAYLRWDLFAYSWHFNKSLPNAYTNTKLCIFVKTL